MTATAKSHKKEAKRGRPSQLRRFVADNPDSTWKVRDLCLSILGRFNKKNEKKLKGYFSRLRAYLLGEPQQLVLPIKKNGLIEGYRAARPHDAGETEKLLNAYIRRQENALSRAHKALDVAQVTGLVADQTIEFMRRRVPEPVQTKIPFA